MVFERKYYLDQLIRSDDILIVGLYDFLLGKVDVWAKQ